MSDISPLYFLIPTGVSSPSSRITVPLSPAQRRSNVPYQMLLLLEEMQCGKCKAVGPTELARCLAEHRVKCKQPLPGAHLCSAHSNISPRNPEIPGVTQCSLQLPPSWVQCCVLIVKRGKKNPKKPSWIYLLISKGWEGYQTGGRLSCGGQRGQFIVWFVLLHWHHDSERAAVIY